MSDFALSSSATPPIFATAPASDDGASLAASTSMSSIDLSWFFSSHSIAPLRFPDFLMAREARAGSKPISRSMLRSEVVMVMCAETRERRERI